ncbi:MAG: hypothetical protein JSS30_05070 [Verrucomicrobia bacterium]|nr:hypothetical protein [Verrucomicrobiota bacterium]
MNILPLVSAFIILFAIGSYAFVHSLRTTAQESFHYKGALAVERRFANQIQKEIYEAQKAKKEEEKEKTESEQNQNKKFVSHRDKFSTQNNRKILIKKLGSDPQLEKVVLRLLKDIYDQTPIYTTNMEHEVVSVLITAIKQNPSAITFEELLPKLPDSQIPLFYKLIKGTQNYELRKSNSGYPALGDFLTLEGKSIKPINFYYASRTVLKALFGEKLCEQIIIAEKLKWESDHKAAKHLMQKELDAFFTKINVNYSEYEPLLHFSSGASKASQEIVQDESTKLKVRINP